MRYLTLDTTTKVSALSLAEDGELVGESFLHTGINHSERLIPMLDQLLYAADWNLKTLDFIGVVRGPGSFTGIRIGIATAQGLAQVLGIPLIGVVSLDVLSWAGYGRKEEIAVILDARKNEWYAARYRWTDSPFCQRQCLVSPKAVKPEVFLLEIRERGLPVIFAGDAVAKAEPLIRDSLGGQAVILPAFQALPRGAYCASEVWFQWSKHSDNQGYEKADETKAAEDQVEPFYIRLSEAEVNYRKKNKNKEDNS